MNEQLMVRCACGWETTGSAEEVVAATGEHGERLNNMSATREQILAMAVQSTDSTLPAAVDDPATSSGSG